jgi:hypothetical protein
MSDTTNIMDLPIDPAGGGNVSNNISMSAQESVNTILPQHATADNTSLDQTTISQLVNGLQQATTSGVTQLPSRDISQITTGITQDPNIQPNYIPHQNKSHDYIQNYEENEDIIDNYNRKYKNNNSLDEMYNEIQVPLLLFVLYFLFQLPIFRKTLFNYLPFLFSKDGNYNIKGFLFSSLLYGFVFYIINKIIVHFSTF